MDVMADVAVAGPGGPRLIYHKSMLSATHSFFNIGYIIPYPTSVATAPIMAS